MAAGAGRRFAARRDRASGAGRGTLATALRGLSDALHQRLVPGRSPEPLDVVADSIGGLFGVLGAARLLRARRAPVDR